MADPCVELTASALCNDLCPLCGLRGGGTMRYILLSMTVGAGATAARVQCRSQLSARANLHLVNSRCQPRTRLAFQGYDMIKAHA